MTFMTSQQIKSALAQPVPLIEGFDLKRVTTACYELALGHESCITSSSIQRERHKTADLITIPPGQFGLLISEESVNIPPRCPCPDIDQVIAENAWTGQYFWFPRGSWIPGKVKVFRV